ncbi:hypothetical protein [Pseudoalteromonas sp. T1lg76]|uniref:hypothetical protein n=1 Tax=Pseudoalteromonas sp. T1lg76 TaxID=2077103 RepID=UPI000CF6A395|nr:hypothetical protein [Pseudoalteromonas sp. T1lg76]
MRLTTFVIGAALFCLAPLDAALAKPEHFVPPGQEKKLVNHDDRDHKYRHEGDRKRYDRHERDRKRHDKHHSKHKRDRHYDSHHDRRYYGYHKKHKRNRHYYCDHYSHRRHDRYWRVGHHIDYDLYRHGRILRRDRHGHVIVDMHGDIFRVLENSLEIVEILSRRH